MKFDQDSLLLTRRFTISSQNLLKFPKLTALRRSRCDVAKLKDQ